MATARFAGSFLSSLAPRLSGMFSCGHRGRGLAVVDVLVAVTSL